MKLISFTTLALLAVTSVAADRRLTDQGSLRRRLGNGGLQDFCNPNKNNPDKDCMKGFYCQPVFGSSTHKGQCIPKKDCFSYLAGTCVKQANNPPPGAKCYDTKKECKKDNKEDNTPCFSYVGGKCVKQTVPMPGSQCYDSKKACNDHWKPNGSCWSPKGNQCVKLSQKPGKHDGQQCYATSRQCQDAMEHNNKPNGYCWSNKGGQCVKLSQKPGKHDGQQCYATSRQCQDAMEHNNSKPNQSCMSCLSKNMGLLGTGTFCWKDRRCYGAMQFSLSSPCRFSTSVPRSSTCATKSRSPFVANKCARQHADCIKPEGM